ncbi:hypothetical protein LLG95_00575 [bacterium]|nr:hypothetical protein [bacterium]
MPSAAELTTLLSSADSAERLLLSCFKAAEGNGTTFSMLQKMVNTLARLTSIRKSLVNLTENKPNPQSSDSPDLSQDSHSSHDSHSPEIAEPSIHEVPSLPAMPFDRIAGALDDITRDLTDQLRQSPHRATQTDAVPETSPAGNSALRAPHPTLNSDPRSSAFHDSRSTIHEPRSTNHVWLGFATHGQISFPLFRNRFSLAPRHTVAIHSHPHSPCRTSPFQANELHRARPGILVPTPHPVRARLPSEASMELQS